jgi:hypothetical protein
MGDYETVYMISFPNYVSVMGGNITKKGRV